MEFLDTQNDKNPPSWGVKQAWGHLPMYKLDLPDPIFGVPELQKDNAWPKNKKRLCENFEGLISETLMFYRYRLKTPASYLSGAHFGHKISPKYWC